MQALVQAKWKETLARDHIGFQNSRIYQFEELTAEIVEEAVREIREVWPQLASAVVQSSLEA